MASSEQDQFVRELARNVIDLTAPDAADRFDVMATSYFGDRVGALRRNEPDAKLGSGASATVDLVMATLFVADKVGDYYANLMVGAFDRWIRRFIKSRRRVQPSLAELPPLAPAQEDDLRAFVQNAARRYGLTALAEEAFAPTLAILRDSAAGPTQSAPEPVGVLGFGGDLVDKPGTVDSPAVDEDEYGRQLSALRPIEFGLDERVRFVTILGLWWQAAVWSLLTAGVFTILGTVAFASNLSSEAVDRGDLGGTDLIFVAGIGATVIVFWIVVLVGRRSEGVGEWRRLLEGKADAATSAYAAIYGTLSARQIPVKVRARRVRCDVLGRETVNNQLNVSDGQYVVSVSVFAYGTSLYVGWMMWRSRRGMTLIATVITSWLGNPFRRTETTERMLRAEKVRAMREAVDAAVRAGVDVALNGIDVSLTATFGYELLIDNAVGLAPVPPPVPGAMPVEHPMDNSGYRARPSADITVGAPRQSVQVDTVSTPTLPAEADHVHVRGAEPATAVSKAMLASLVASGDRVSTVKLSRALSDGAAQVLDLSACTFDRRRSRLAIDIERRAAHIAARAQRGRDGELARSVGGREGVEL